MSDELIKRLRGRALFCRDRGEVKSPELHDEAADYIDLLEKKLKLFEKVDTYLKTSYPDKSGHFFIAGKLGSVDQNLLPEELLICPAYGCDWMQIYKRTERTTGPEW